MVVLKVLYPIYWDTLDFSSLVDIDYQRLSHSLVMFLLKLILFGMIFVRLNGDTKERLS